MHTSREPGRNLRFWAMLKSDARHFAVYGGISYISMIISSCPKNNFRSLVFALPIPSYLLGDLRHGKTHVPLSGP